ncbi:SWIB/MDM2 domain [Pseudocohnilembus persalinus]|uniref:SWIB/MDM2 domain n=1 Tax=Pseudocohnilembus persalinus TaxID=266149 RepID=A0A0V0QNB5_PSEPJ|nr:SWIB/MDM2 domain [Pseudocohnilembus persalinus]|eukprot:KRX03628.1 SWIB/MDM2 domain [Pseudocohnilembus persalinus]
MCDNQGQTDGPLTHWQIKLEGKLLTNNIEFQRKEPIAESDCILIQREGNQEFETCIDLEVLNNPPKFKVKKELANIIGMNNCSRTEILTAIWEYIKMQNLQDRENKNLINNDEALKNIFGVDKMTMGSITSRIKDLIDLEDPVQIQHTVTSIPQERIFDMQVDVPYPFGLEIMPFLSQKVVMDEKKDSQMIHPFMELNQNIKKLEKKQLEYLERLKSHKYKRDSYYAYSLQPSLFIENILLQQNQLLKIMNQTSKPALNEPNQLSYFVENEEEVLKQLTELIDEHQNSKQRQRLQQQQQQHQQQNQQQQHGHMQQQHPIPNISQNNQPQQN